MDWLKNAFSDHTFLFFFAFVGIPMIVISLKEIVMLLIKHRERMAMIEHGMDPNAHQPPPRAKKSFCGKETESTPVESVK